MAYRVIADHIRTLTFALSDGGVPDKDARGYVLRRILRRAVRYAHQKLKAPAGFFASLVPVVVDKMGDAFPELRKDPKSVMELIQEEEDQFRRTLDRGIRLFEKIAEKTTNSGQKVISGKDAFFLYDTYGFPKDLTQLMAEERGLSVNMVEYEEELSKSKLGKKVKDTDTLSVELDVHAINHLKDKGVPNTNDSAKYGREPTPGKILAIYEKAFVEKMSVTDDTQIFGIVLDNTCFYAEQGGQTFDTGVIELEEKARFSVENVQVYGGYVLHVGYLTFGSLTVGDEVISSYDEIRRGPIRRNHTATHLLNYALREVVGKEVDQKGSLVAPNRFRFDFSAKKPVSNEQIAQIEKIVQTLIDNDLEVFYKNTPLNLAKQITGLRAVFGEVYPDPVRVLSVGFSVDDLLKDPASEKWLTASIEFCGGTHVSRTSDIRSFVVINETAVAKGIRRIIAVTGSEARRAQEEGERFSKKVEEIKDFTGKSLGNAVNELQQELDGLPEDSMIPMLKKDQIRERLSDLKKVYFEYSKGIKQARYEEFLKTIKTQGEAHDPSRAFVEIVNLGSNGKDLTTAVRAFPNQSVSVLLISTDEDNSTVTCVAYVPKELNGKLKAKDWVQEVIQVFGGKGGGNEQAAQGTGSLDNDKLTSSKQIALDYANSRL